MLAWLWVPLVLPPVLMVLLLLLDVLDRRVGVEAPRTRPAHRDVRRAPPGDQAEGVDVPRAA